MNTTKTCWHCGVTLPPPRRIWCSDACRKRGELRRARGLREDAVPQGRRGRLRLDQPTRAETLARVLADIRAYRARLASEER